MGVGSTVWGHLQKKKKKFRFFYFLVGDGVFSEFKGLIVEVNLQVSVVSITPDASYFGQSIISGKQAFPSLDRVN